MCRESDGGGRASSACTRARFLGSERTAAETPPRLRITRRPPPSGSGTRARTDESKMGEMCCIRVGRSFSFSTVALLFPDRKTTEQINVKNCGGTGLPLSLNLSRFGKRMLLLWTLERTRMIHLR